MKEPKWISKRAVLAIHERLLVEHGGLAGMVEEGRLDSALTGPKNHLHFRDADLFTLAAVYAYALTRNHPFHDGNKRIALTVAGVFLELNGYRLSASEQEAVAAACGISDGSMDLAGYAAWLRASSVALRRTKARPHAKKRPPPKK